MILHSRGDLGSRRNQATLVICYGLGSPHPAEKQWVVGQRVQVRIKIEAFHLHWHQASVSPPGQINASDRTRRQALASN